MRIFALMAVLAALIGGGVPASATDCSTSCTNSSAGGGGTKCTTHCN